MKAVKEKKIKYYKYIPFTQPVLTGNITPTESGCITVNATSYHSADTAPYMIMLGSVSSTVDNDYWQLANSNAEQSLTITFPYRLRVSSVSITTRPKDNYTRNVGIYTEGGVQLGSNINARAALTQYTAFSSIPLITNIIKVVVYAGSGQNTYFGLQNLQINAEKIVEANSCDYDFFAEVDKFYLPRLKNIYYGINIL